MSPNSRLRFDGRRASKHQRSRSQPAVATPAVTPELKGYKPWCNAAVAGAAEEATREKGDKEGNESRVEGDGKETRGLCLLFCLPDTHAFAKEATEEKQYHTDLQNVI